MVWYGEGRERQRLCDACTRVCCAASATRLQASAWLPCAPMAVTAAVWILAGWGSHPCMRRDSCVRPRMAMRHVRLRLPEPAATYARTQVAPACPFCGLLRILMCSRPLPPPLPAAHLLELLGQKHAWPTPCCVKVLVQGTGTQGARGPDKTSHLPAWPWRTHGRELHAF